MTVHGDCPTCTCQTPLTVDEKCAQCGLDFMQLVHGNQGHVDDHEFQRPTTNERPNHADV